jgi:hypothetical protein
VLMNHQLSRISADSIVNLIISLDEY